jgi:hypothetical protein
MAREDRARYVLRDGALEWFARRDPKLRNWSTGKPNVAAIARAAGLDEVTFKQSVDGVNNLSAMVMAGLTDLATDYGVTRAHAERTLYSHIKRARTAVAA